MQVLTEREIDKAFVKALAKAGLVSIKLSTLGAYGAGGWPDRLVLLPGGVPVFVELKRPGAKPTRLQAQRLAKLSALGFFAEWHDNANEAVAFVKRIDESTVVMAYVKQA